jgi:hypothetical protein
VEKIAYGTAHLCVILTNACSSEKVIRIFFVTNIMLIDVCLFEYLCSVQKYIFCSVKPRALLYMDLSVFINCNTFSVVHSLIMEQCALKIVNNCFNTNIYSYLETSGGQSSNLYLNVGSFLQHQCKLVICGSLRQLFSCIGV